MPMLVHIAPEKDIGSIRRAGIRIGKFRTGVYAMPVLKNFMVSHQWLRELKRGGDRTLSAVHFRIPDGETVLMGHYSKEQVQVTAAQAAHAIMHAKDPLGMQIIVPRAIARKEIHAILAESNISLRPGPLPMRSCRQPQA
jgi:hypothetical protein